MSVTEFKLDDTAEGFSEFSDNCWNFSISVNMKGNDCAAEYKAGFIQGKLQKNLIPAVRDNTWNNMYHCDPRMCQHMNEVMQFLKDNPVQYPATVGRD
jgi:hypothetical protein